VLVFYALRWLAVRRLNISAAPRIINAAALIARTE
jgi:hypothetical protein